MARIAHMASSQTEHCSGLCQTMRKRLWEYQQRREYCDVILETDEQEQVWAHRVILASGSEVLHHKLMDSQTSKKNEATGTPTLKLPDVKLDNLRDMVRFFYLGNVERISMMTVGLWERFQISQQIQLLEETSEKAKSSDVDPAVVHVTEIKSEDESPLGEIDSDDEVTEEENYLPANDNIHNVPDEIPDDRAEVSPEQESIQPKMGEVKSEEQNSQADLDSTLKEEPVASPVTAPVEENTKIETYNTRAKTKRKIFTRKGKRKLTSPRGKRGQKDLAPEDNASSDESEQTFEGVMTRIANKRLRKRVKQDPDYDEGSDSSEKPDPTLEETKNPRRGTLKKMPTRKGAAKKKPVKNVTTKRGPQTKDEPLGDKCKWCNLKFESEEQHLEHQQAMHNGRHICSECGSSFSRATRLKTHRMIKHNQGREKGGPRTTKELRMSMCKTCNIQFETIDEYKEHRETMHKPRHKCVECGATFNRPNRLKAHRVMNHFQEGLPQPIWYYCKEEGCNYKSCYSDILEVHRKTMHKNERPVCELCGVRFCSKFYMKRHIIKVHGGEGPRYPCDECHKCFYIQAQLKNHKDQVHRKTLNFLCDQCPYASYNKRAVENHMFSVHGIPIKERPIYSCPHCNYKNHAKKPMQAHIERHGTKDFKCDQCESVFRCNRDLNEHKKRKHSENRTMYRCHYEGCKYATPYGTNKLKEHISRMHENKDYKPWACHECDYRSNIKGNLHLHLKKVHGIKPIVNKHYIERLPYNNDSKPVLLTIGQEEQGLEPQPTEESVTEMIPQNLPGSIPENMQENLAGHVAIHVPGHIQVSLQDQVPTAVMQHISPSLQEHVPNVTAVNVPVTIPVNLAECPPVMNLSVARTESPVVQITPVFQAATEPETMPRAPSAVPVMVTSQFEMMVPQNGGYDQNLYIQAPQ